jgi:hypothetical protein
MAVSASFTSGIVTVTSTATLVLAANADRVSAIFKVMPGDEGVFFGPDNTVTADDGFYVTAADDSVKDEAPTTGDWYAVTRAGKHAKVSFIEVVDTSS